MSERVVVGGLALLNIFSIFLAPWAALHREFSKGAVLLLPNRIIDFTGNLAPIEIPHQILVLFLSIIALLVIVLASLLKSKLRLILWSFAGVLLISITIYGWHSFSISLEEARIVELTQIAEEAIAKPKSLTNVEGIQGVLGQIHQTPTHKSANALKAYGVRIKILPYNNAAMGLSSFLSLIVSLLAIIFSFRYSAKFSTLLDKILHKIAVPATSILLALIFAGIVILALQPTPLGRGVEINNFYTYLAGRLDTLWYAYQTIFTSSLASTSGFMEVLKFATPLIFTGLAVAIVFHAGLFNIGAPGQMILGAIFAMLVGIYVSGPKLIVLPLAVLAAILGGGLWGGLAGWLKARFGANEVINTILLNYIASSLLLFLLSASHTFAAPALRVITYLPILLFITLVLNLIPYTRKFIRSSPHLAIIFFGIMIIGVTITAGWPRSGDSPITFTLPFKAPGSEPKSQPITEAARFEQLPEILGIDLEKNPGTNIIPINYSLILAITLSILSFIILPKLGKHLAKLLPRIINPLFIGAGTYILGLLLGLNHINTTIPPTRLNTSFLLAILAAIFIHYFLWHTKWGYELRAVGFSPKAAEYGGISTGKITILVMFMGGSLAGLTACHYVLGGALEEYSLRQALPTNDGFDGIAVALLGNNTPIGVVLSALLFGVLKNGGGVMNITFSELTRDVVNMILALVVLFIAAKGFLPKYLIKSLDKDGG